MKALIASIPLLLGLVLAAAQTQHAPSKTQETPKTTRASEQDLSERLAGMKIQMTAEILQKLQSEIELMKQQIRQDLRSQLAQELRVQLKQELRQELKQELKQEIKQELR
jgi:hypothetical protein